MKRAASPAAQGEPVAKAPRLTPGPQGAPVPVKLLSQREKLPTVQYRNGRPLRDLLTHLNAGRARVEVIIPADDCTGHNKQVKSRQLWGDGVYTDDSDMVAVLMHTGYYAANTAANPPQVQAFHAVVQLLPPQERYPSSLRNSVRSRAWMAKVEGCSFKVERCFIATRSAHMVELAASGEDGAIVQPTFAPNAGDKQMSTRSTAGSGRNKQSPEVTVLYNLCNEPWLKYSMSGVADQGLRSSQWTSARLRSQTLYLETSRERFELSYQPPGDQEERQQDLYQLARCKCALPLATMTKLGVPMPPAEGEVLQSGVAWDEFKWSNLSMAVRGQSFQVVRMHFMPNSKPGGGGAASSS
ncbi:MAG: hypothetical protein J3K34DRAFT_403140 [Monoraphidium minutum]|nr:MAG: hypothetical protein J3K34DRAFT_403140 [Monoraphidium minutum]